MLFERQRDVEMVDVLLLDDFGGVGQRAEQRQAAIAEMIAAGAIVDEADHLIAELAMLKNFFGDDAAEVAGAGDEDALEPDAGLPAPLEHFAHELARAERERHVEDEEQGPDHARHFVRAAILQLGRDVVGLEIQRADDAEHHRDDAADEDGEEVVHARAAAAQAVEPLKLIGERHQHADERQHRDVLRKRRVAFDDRNQAAGKSNQVGEAERHDAEHGIRGHVKGHQQAAVASKHGRWRPESSGQTPPRRTAPRAGESRPNQTASAWRARCRPRTPPGDDSSTSTPVTPSITVSSAPPRASATTGRPQACASTGAMPKSSSPGSSTAAARR